MSRHWKFNLCLIFSCVFPLPSFAANAILPSVPVGGSVYMLPGVYGALGDLFWFW